MIFHVLRKELLGHLLTLRFVLGGICCLALIAMSAFVLTGRFESRLEAHRTAVTDYEGRLRKVQVYSELGQRTRPEAHRPPNPLSILSSGVQERMGDYTILAHGYVPISAESSGSDNPYLAIFPAIDFVTVFQILLSLLALLFAYDAVSGEGEDGTLKLVLASSVPRSSVLLGKYLGAMLALAIPLLLSLGIGLIFATASGYVSFTAGEWGRIGLLVVLSLLYLSLFYLAGLVCSCAASRSASALAFCLFAWVAAVLIFPGASAFLVDRLSPIEPTRSVDEAAGELTGKVRERSEEFLTQSGRKGVWEGVNSSAGSSSSNSSTGSGETVRARIRSAKDPELTFQREYFRNQENFRVEIADQVWQLQREYLERNPYRQARLARTISAVSPAAVYEHAATVLAGTDLQAHRRFMDQARAYRRELVQYLQDTDAFGSRTWFAHDRETADVEAVPRFRWRPEPLGQSFRRSGVDLVLLVGWNAVLFWAAYILFARRRVA